MADLTLIEGPAGSAKSAIVEDKLRAGEVDVVADLTAMWAALRAVRRGPDGRYPTRTASDPAIRTGLAAYMRRTAVRQGLRSQLKVVVTSGSRHEAEIYAALAEELGVTFERMTEDPGLEVVTERLADPETGQLSSECERALGRWYG